MSIFNPTPQERLARIQADLAKHQTAGGKIAGQLASTSNEIAWSKLDSKRRYHAAQVTRLEGEVVAAQEAVEAAEVEAAELKRAAEVKTHRAQLGAHAAQAQELISELLESTARARAAAQALDDIAGANRAAVDRLHALGDVAAEPFDLLREVALAVLDDAPDCALQNEWWHVREMYDGAGLTRQRARLNKDGLRSLIAPVLQPSPASIAVRSEQRRRLAHVDGQALVVALPAPKIEPTPVPLHEVELRAAGESTKYIAGVDLTFDEYIGGGHLVALLRGGRDVPEGAEVVSIDRADLDGATIEISTLDDGRKFVSQVDRPRLLRTSVDTYRVAQPGCASAAAE